MVNKEEHNLKSAVLQLLEVLPIEYDYHGNMADKDLEKALVVVRQYLKELNVPNA